jgi:peptidoglycan-associated lipoprotein
MRTAIRLLLPALTLALAMGACAPKKTTEEPTSGPAPVTEEQIDQGVADSDSGKAMGLQTVYYGYDSSALDSGAKATLTANAQILKERQNIKVQLEGHTDERGGIQYNIALGERRANSAKAFLVDQGVSADRISIISYGKEKPLDPGHDEAAWSKNRRANFRITEK